MNDDIDNTIIMEYNSFQTFISQYLWDKSNVDFNNWLKANPDLLY
jgi:hypothetical protein